MLREVFIFIAAFAAFASGIAVYLLAAHGMSSMKEIVSTAIAALIGLYIGRYIQNRLDNG